MICFLLCFVCCVCVFSLYISIYLYISISISKYLGLLFTDKLLWDQHIAMVIKKRQQGLWHLRRLFARRQLLILIKTLAPHATASVAIGNWRASTDHRGLAQQLRTGSSTRVSPAHSSHLDLRVNQKVSCTALRTIPPSVSLAYRQEGTRWGCFTWDCC